MVVCPLLFQPDTCDSYHLHLKQDGNRYAEFLCPQRQRRQWGFPASTSTSCPLTNSLIVSAVWFIISLHHRFNESLVGLYASNSSRICWDSSPTTLIGAAESIWSSFISILITQTQVEDWCVICCLLDDNFLWYFSTSNLILHDRVLPVRKFMVIKNEPDSQQALQYLQIVQHHNTTWTKHGLWAAMVHGQGVCLDSYFNSQGGCELPPRIWPWAFFHHGLHQLLYWQLQVKVV